MGEVEHNVKDPSLRARLGSDGFAVVPFIDRGSVAELHHVQASIADPADHGLTIDYMRSDRSAMAEIRRRAVPLLADAVERLFDEPRIIMATFVTKHPGPESAMFLHEDRVYVDEANHRAVTLWIPLCDSAATLRNGHLEVVPASHRLPIGPTGSNTVHLEPDVEARLRDHLRPLSVPEGHAAVYDSRLLHMSPPNESDHRRTALVVVVIPRSAEAVHVRRSGHRLRFHRVDEDFYVDLHPRSVELGIPERYPCVAEMPEPVPIGQEAVEEWLASRDRPVGGSPFPIRERPGGRTS